MRALIGLWAEASAGSPVVADGVEASFALARAAEITGRPVEELTLVEADTLVGPFVAGARLSPCDGPQVDPARASEILDRIDGALGWGEISEARALLGELDAQIACSGALSAGDRARSQLLSGVVAAVDGASTRASASFAAARSADLGASWDDAWPAGRELFERARPSEIATLESFGVVRLDGQQIPAGASQIAVGLHIAEVGDLRGALWVDAPREVALIDGRALRGRPISDRASRETANELLSARFGSEEPLLVVSAQKVWSVWSSEGRWSVEDRVMSGSRKAIGWSMLSAGALSGLTLGPYALMLRSGAARAAEEMSQASGTGDFLGAEARYERRAGALSAVRWAPVASGLIFSAGVGVLTLDLPAPRRGGER